MAQRQFKPYTKRSRYSRGKSRFNSSRKLILIAVGVIIILIIGIQMMGKDGDDVTNDNTVNNDDSNSDDIIDEIISEIEESTNESDPADDEIVVEGPDTGGGPEVTITDKPEPVKIEIEGTFNAEAEKLMVEAKKDIESGRIIAARNKLNSVLGLKIGSNTERRIKLMMSTLSDKWLFSREMYPEDKLIDTYLVQSGENFESIGRRHKVPYELLMSINNIKQAKLLRANANIKVVNGPFNAVVHRDSFTMDLYLQRTYVKSYDIGTGKAGRETPVGKWQVKPGGKLSEKQPWTDPDTGKVYTKNSPDYPLGERWIAIEGLDDQTKPRTGFAFHGTKDPESIGKRSSRGCIRLHNNDVIELYNMLVTTHSKVNIKAD